MTRRAFALILPLSFLDGIQTFLGELLWGGDVCVKTDECYQQEPGVVCRAECHREGGLLP
jgi:hypothetical protein